jgi:prefoldin subunit 5
LRYSAGKIPRMLMEQKIQELQEQIKTIEETLDEIKQVLNIIAERETEVTNEAEYFKNVL